MESQRLRRLDKLLALYENTSNTPEGITALILSAPISRELVDDYLADKQKNNPQKGEPEERWDEMSYGKRNAVIGCCLMLVSIPILAVFGLIQLISP